MKAISILNPGEIAVVDLPTPSAKEGEATLVIRRIGYCGSDLSTFRGVNPLVSYPRIPGHEIAAEITGGTIPAGMTIGQTVTVVPYTNCGSCAACRRNRPNACMNNQTLGVQREGALTEQLSIAAEKLVAAPGLSLAELALVEPLAVGFHAVERGCITDGDYVCVFGCGMIGLGAIAGAALRQGARVISVDLDEQKLVVARRAGASYTVNSAKEDLSARLLELTDGHGPDVCIEAVGLPVTFRAAVDEVAYGGRVVYIGYAKEPVSYETKYFLLKELDILGSRGATRKNFEQVIEVLQSGRYPVDATITQTVPMSDACAAMESWAANPVEITKIQVEL